MKNIISIAFISILICVSDIKAEVKFGVVASDLNPWTIREENIDIEKMFNLMREAGIKWVRIPLYWSQIKNIDNDELNFSYFLSSGNITYDDIVRTAKKYDIQILAILMGGYEPFIVPKCPSNWKEKDYIKWQEFIKTVVDRYKPNSEFWNDNNTNYGITHWQIWNEPSYKMYWGRPYLPENEGELVNDYDAGKYINLLNCTTPVIKNCYQYPKLCKIVLGGIVTSESEHYRYWQKLYEYIKNNQYNSDDLFDIVGINYYKHPKDSGLDYYLSLLRYGVDNQSIHWKGLDYYEDNDKPVWITEVGWPVDFNKNCANPINESTQSEYFINTFSLSKDSRVDNVFWFCFRDSKKEKDCVWGLADSNLNKRGIFKRYKQLSNNNTNYYFSGEYRKGKSNYTIQSLNQASVKKQSPTGLIGSCNGFYYGQKLFARESYAYVVDYHGLKVVDISNPTNPVIIGSCTIAESSFDIFESSNTAYIAGGSSGLIIADISNPGWPVIVSSVNTSGITRAVAVNDGYAYIADDFSLRIIDISNPLLPFEVGYCINTSQINDVKMYGNYACVVVETALLNSPVYGSYKFLSSCF